MTAKPTNLLIGACLAALALAAPAAAQPSDSNISFAPNALMLKKPAAGLPDVKAQPQAWPRLDPGAMFCRSEADLDKLGARRRGERVEGSIDCQVVRTATAISIVQRSGPGRTEIKISGSETSGWTDAWLPDKGNAGATPVSR